MSGLYSFMEGYNNFMKTNIDPRTKDWFLSGKPGHVLVILVTYVYFCTKAGPRFMKDKKPFELKKTIQIYNLLQVFASVYLFYEGLAAGWGTDYNYTCQPVIPGEKGLRMAKAVYLYFICKLVELLDTVFFILRKKNSQVTYLHLYHHTLMPVCAWVGVTFLPGGHGTLLGLINCLIHVIMYAYYFLSSLGPQYQAYLWWKKYVTSLQMIQFCIVFWHNFQVLFKTCDFPKVLNGILAVQAAYFLYLFGCFYVNSYMKNKKNREDQNSNRVNKSGLIEKTKNHTGKNGTNGNGYVSVDNECVPVITGKTKTN